MAEKTKDKKPAEAAQAVNEENVMETLKTKNHLTQENVKAALERIKKDEDEKQQADARNMIMCAQYNNFKELIELRARRREEKITKETLAKSKEVLDQVLDGKMTPTEYKTAKQKLYEEKRKAIEESNKKLSEDRDELRNSYTGEYRYAASWDY